MKEGKIPYNKELAAELQEKHNLTDAAIRNWKYRGIPGKYADPDYQPSETAPVKLTKRAVEILLQPELKHTELSSIEKPKVLDVIAYRTGKDKTKTQNFSVEEITALKSELTRIRNLLRQFTTTSGQKQQKALVSILKCHQIKHFVLFKGMENMIYRLADESIAYPNEIDEAAVRVALFYDKIKL